MGMRWSGAEHTGGDVVVNVATREQFLADIRSRLAAGRGFCVATLNLDHVVKLRRQPVFRRAYVQHSHVTADGNPIVWLSRLAGEPVTLLPGSELILPSIECAHALRVPIALFGSTPESLAATRGALLERYPDLQIAATLSPPMGFDPESPEADSYIAELGASGVRLCFLALGAPKQEIFAVRAAKAQPQIGFMSIGAGLDFISGRQIRAPKIVRRLAGEWLWRLALNPRRLAARYAACIAVLPSLLRAALRARRATGQRTV